jgi:hypothetical protein
MTGSSPLQSSTHYRRATVTRDARSYKADHDLALGWRYGKSGGPLAGCE